MNDSHKGIPSGLNSNEFAFPLGIDDSEGGDNHSGPGRGGDTSLS
jgi:hypothetical protein